jgi:hypothetical protein
MNGWEISSYIYLAAMLLFNIILTIVVSIGGYADLKYLFKSLREEVVDETDDGRIKQQNLKINK